MEFQKNYNEVLGKRSVEVLPEQLGEHIGGIVSLHGAVYKIRKMSGFAFVLLRTAREILQCIYGEEFSEFPLSVLKEESCVRVRAKVTAEERSKTGWELHLLRIEVLSEAAELSPVVINNKCLAAAPETVLDYRPVTLRNEKERAVFRIQEGLAEGFRRFLRQERFVEVHTPKLVQTGAEGGANIFKLDYFGKEAYLAQSPQFYKQMLVSVYERVYEIAPVFRAEHHDTARHLNEYTSVDFEMGYLESFEEIMWMENRMLISALEFLKEEYGKELALLSVRLPKLAEIPRIKFSEAKEWIEKEYRRETMSMEDLEPEEERLLCELAERETGSELVFVTHYPSTKRPFYAMECEENKAETKSFDLLFRGLEVTTGGQRIHSYKEQVEKLLARGMHPELFESYLQLHKYGVPPHGGLGLGLERFTSRLLELPNVRMATLFPRDIHRLVP